MLLLLLLTQTKVLLPKSLLLPLKNALLGGLLQSTDLLRTTLLLRVTLLLQMRWLLLLLLPHLLWLTLVLQVSWLLLLVCVLLWQQQQCLPCAT